MSAIYTIQAKSINQAALFFAERGYHVNTSFSPNNGSMNVTVYFDHSDDKELIEQFIQPYKEKSDKLKYHELVAGDNDHFCTISLTKYPL